MSEPCEHCWHLVEKTRRNFRGTLQMSTEEFSNFYEMCCFCGMERDTIPAHKLAHGPHLPEQEGAVNHAGD
jgi:hypothetical protein